MQPVNNWDAWICWNWLTTALFVDRNEDRRYRSVEKILLCLDKFINTYPDDGGCEEGPGYWNVAAGAMFDSLELLYSATSGAVDIFGQPLITQMALYMNRVHIDGDYYLNQGDASPIIHLDVDKMYRFGRRLKNQDLISLAVSSIPAKYHPDTCLRFLTRRSCARSLLPNRGCCAIPGCRIRALWRPGKSGILRRPLSGLYRSRQRKKS